jgi:hypothetical protein
MRWWAVLVLLVVVFFGSVLLTAIAGLHNCSATDGLLLDRLGVLQGHVSPLLASPFVWSRYPAAPSHLSSLVSTRAFLTTVPLILAALCLPHALRRRSFPLSIGICVVVAAVPYVAGMVALHDNTVPEKVGPWLSIMFLGPLYVLVVCAFVCVVELMRPSTRSRPSCLPDAPSLARSRVCREVQQGAGN